MVIASVLLGVGLLAGFLGLFLGRLTGGQAEMDRTRSTVFGIAGLGLALGMMLGLSTSPVLGASIAAGFALIGTLLPMYFPKPVTVASDAPARPLPISVWLFPFAGSTILGMVLGIGMRVNDALDFRSQSLRDRYKAQGFDDRQVSDIMDRLAHSIRGPELAQVTAVASVKPTVVETGLQADLSPMKWKDFWEQQDRLGLSPEASLAQFKQIAPANVLDQIQQLESRYAAEILKAVRKDHPEIGGEK